jgi:hypothetical protein
MHKKEVLHLPSPATKPAMTDTYSTMHITTEAVANGDSVHASQGRRPAPSKRRSTFKWMYEKAKRAPQTG